MNQSHKRKRGRPAPVLETPEQRAAKCLSKYHHAGIEATRHLKKALVFELQKLTKRLKHSREADKGSDAEKRLVEELEACKTLETNDIAKYYLHYTIQKSHKQLLQFLTLGEPPLAPHRDASDASKNVVARLLGSKTFRAFLSDCIARLETIAGIQEATIKTDQHDSAEKSRKKEKPVHDELPFTTFDKDDAIDTSSDDEDLISARVSRTETQTLARATNSTFLPSLQSGYLPAENGSSDDEQELKGLFPAQKKERKNRRGQRARRKILEAKHGNKANHLVKEREEKKREYEERLARRAAREEAKTGANAIAIEVAEKNRRERREAALRPIHDSWAIAKAQKEKLKNAKPQGTKISFD